MIAESFVDGWFRTGDLASIGADGYVTILGRSKELIISGGLNVYPREVEEVLLSHPDVAEAAVVGTPSDEWGEVVTAFVVPASERRTEESLLAFAAEQLAPLNAPASCTSSTAFPATRWGRSSGTSSRAEVPQVTSALCPAARRFVPRTGGAQPETRRSLPSCIWLSLRNAGLIRPAGCANGVPTSW